MKNWLKEKGWWAVLLVISLAAMIEQMPSDPAMQVGILITFAAVIFVCWLYARSQAKTKS